MVSSDSPETDICPTVEGAFRLVGKKWTGMILHVLASGDKRFSELLDLVPRISSRILSQRLAELEGEGMVNRSVFPETPVRVLYSLTEKGQALTPILGGLAQWAHRWAKVKA